MSGVLLHCDGPDCGGPLSCSCVCVVCNLEDRMRTWAMRAKSAQVALDLSKDPESIAIRAGQLLDLAEDIEGTLTSLGNEYKREHPQGGST